MALRKLIVKSRKQTSCVPILFENIDSQVLSKYEDVGTI